MRNALIATYCLMAALLSATAGMAQEPGALIDRKEILIGEQAIIRLYVPYLKASPPAVSFPSIGDTIIDGVEVLRLGALDTLATGDDVKETRIEQQVFITSFDSGFYAIPPFEFEINGDKAYTDAFLFTVRTVEIDTTKGIVDIRDIYAVDVTWKDFVAVYWHYTVAGLAVVAAIIAGILFYLRWRRKRKEKPIPVAEAPKLPPYEIAMEALTRIASEKIYTKGEIKAYHSQITDELRSYLEGAFGIQAHELTSSQIMAGLKYSGIDQAQLRSLRTILFRADMVKFAKEKPDEQENEKAIVDATTFVKAAHEVTSATEAETESSDVNPENA